MKKEKSRTENSALNIGSNIAILIVKTFFTFITRTVFIYCLGKEALGLNGLFTNVLSMLSLAELGISTAINFSLYKPLSLKDNKKISILISFYKRVYRIIGFIVLCIGTILIPFLKYIIADINTISNVYFIYILYLINTSASYFISYKETLIMADQRKYKLVKIELLFLIILNILQILFLYLTKNYIIYLIVQLIVQLLQRVVTNVYIGKQYHYIDFNCNEKIPNSDFNIIKKNVKAMFFHKIGDYCINGTDNLIISSFINVITVGLYSNYYVVITLMNSFISTIYNGLTASLGNLIVTETNKRRYEIFKIMNFISFVLHGLIFVLLYNIFNDFIILWIGNDYCLDKSIVFALLVSFYLTGMRTPCTITKNAAGIYDIDKYTPLIQSIINLAFSIVLVNKIGLLGVILGTIISSLALPSWQRPYIVYKYVLKKPCKDYFINYLCYIFIILFSSVTLELFFKLILIDNLLIVLFLKTIITFLFYSILIYVIYSRTEEYKYIKTILRRFIHAK